MNSRRLIMRHNLSRKYYSLKALVSKLHMHNHLGSFSNMPFLSLNEHDIQFCSFFGLFVLQICYQLCNKFWLRLRSSLRVSLFMVYLVLQFLLKVLQLVLLKFFAPKNCFTEPSIVSFQKVSEIKKEVVIFFTFCE